MLQLTFQQRILCFIFFCSNLVATAIGCYGLAKILSDYGGSSALLAFGLAGLVAVVGNLIAYLAGPFVGRGVRFVALHSVLAAAAFLSIYFPEGNYLGPAAFLAVFGLGTMTTAANRLLAQRLISPFEAERLFPLLRRFRLSGVILGSIIIFKLADTGFTLDTEIAHGWLGLELLLAILGITLIRSRTSVHGSSNHGETLSLLQATSQPLKRYPTLRLLLIWTVGWGFCTAFIFGLSAEAFAESSPTSILKTLALIGIIAPLLIVLSNRYVYVKLVEWSRLGGMQLNSILALSVVGIGIGLYPIFWVAIPAWLLARTIHESFHEQAYETQTSLYPLRFREAIVFIFEHTFFGLGMGLVAVLSLLESSQRVGAFAVVALGLVLLARRHNNRFARGVVRLLSSNDVEERRNAIALYDRLEAQDEYEEFIYYLNEGSDHETSIAILKTFSVLKTVQPMPDILNLLSRDNLDNSLRIAILGYVDVLDFTSFDPFLHYRTVETLKKICLESHSNVARAMAIRIFVQNAPAEESVNFVLEELDSADNRVIANAIEGLSHLNYPGVVKLLSPYLKHPVARIRANTIVALWKYPKARFRVKASITSMLFSDEMSHRISGTHATGKVRDDSYQTQLIKQLENAAPALRRVTLVALVELGNLQYLEDIVELILGTDEAHARNTCYLAMSLEPHLLNEGVVARLYHRGPEAREVASSRFSACGRLCRRQLDLLAGRTDQLTRRALV